MSCDYAKSAGTKGDFCDGTVRPKLATGTCGECAKQMHPPWQIAARMLATGAVGNEGSGEV